MDHRCLITFVGLTTLALTGCDQPELAQELSTAVRPAYVYEVNASSDGELRTFVGKVDAKQRVDLSFEVGGELAEFPLRSGTFVQRGDVIARLATEQFALDLQAAEAQQALAKSDLQRKRELLRDGAISSALVDDAINLLKLRDAQFAQAQKAMADTVLRAPFDGHLASRYLENHMAVQPGQAIVRLHDLNQLLIRVSVPEKLFAALDQNTIELHATFAATGDQQFPLSIFEYEGEAGDIAQTYTVTLVMTPVPGLQLLPGMNATVIARQRESVPSLWVPTEALVITPQGEFFVWVVTNERGLIEQRKVQTAAASDAGVRVTSGLAAGETVVTAGVQQLRPGMRVQPIAPPS